jgi:hypothetical protein
VLDNHAQRVAVINLGIQQLFQAKFSLVPRLKFGVLLELTIKLSTYIV